MKKQIEQLIQRIEKLESKVLLLEARRAPVDAVGTREVILKEFLGERLCE